MLKAPHILFWPGLVTLLYCYGALYISTHHKAVVGIRTGTLSKLKHSLKQLKDYSNKVLTGEKIPNPHRVQKKRHTLTLSNLLKTKKLVIK